MTDALFFQTKSALHHCLSNSSSLAAYNPSVQVLQAAFVVFAVSGNSFSDHSSGFHSLFLQSVHAGGRMRQGVKSYVFYIHIEMQTFNRLRGRKRTGGNSLEREGLLECRVEMWGIHTHCRLYCTYTPTEAGFFFKRVVLELYSCPCALSRLLRCGWMEDGAKCFHLSTSIVKSSRIDILTDRKKEERWSRKKSDRFHSFQGCLQCCSLREANQKKKKEKEYCMLLFSDLSQHVLFCYLLVTLWNPSMEICVLEEL